jgi:regulator of sirC expression with transglutaminase-like and TPR domain
MSVDLDFFHDDEFHKLLVYRTDVDLTQVALELARDAQPDLDFDLTLEWIDKRAMEVKRHLTWAKSDQAMLKELSRCLSGTHGLHGDKAAYQHAESSYINRVIETGVGIPISLSLVYVAVAQRAGLELEGVAAPMHFLSRLDSVEGPLFVDAYHNGQVMTFDDCCTWLGSLSGLSSEQIEDSLEPAAPREVVVRLLNNLKAVHVQHEQWQQAWDVQRRLTALHPGDPAHRRDLAIIALKSNRPGTAIDLLAKCLKTCSNRDRALLQSHLHVAERLQAAFN